MPEVEKATKLGNAITVWTKILVAGYTISQIQREKKNGPKPPEDTLG